MNSFDDKISNIADIYTPSLETPYSLPVFMSSIQAGFPSPADDYIEKKLDLNDLIVKNSTATFFVRVEGDSMKEAHINSGDILVVDRSLTASHGKIIVALVDGEFTIKRLLIDANGVTLQPENPLFSSIRIQPQSEFQVWGVVTYVIHQVK